ncbi:MAG: protein kinase [Myxococcales bacterium]|nr:protein kinase [Myxococcales bacterium]
MRPVSVDPQPGETIGGRYEIIRLIARGGVGIVYLGKPVETDDEVVIKVLSASMVGDEEAHARFDREADRLAGVQHPNIVRMIDHGHEQDSPYLVMEYLEGELLADFLDKHCPLSLEVFAPIAAQILKAMNFAHRRGLMHRDIKPTNIMLCERKGRANFVKILDFGLAKLTDDKRDITSEQIIGTANYLSPEQIRGEPIDVRVDVYALGIMFYAMLSGRLPFDADNNAALLYKHVHEEPPPLADALPEDHDIPDDLIALIHQCLAKNPADRPQDAGAMVEALRMIVPRELFQLPLAPGAVATPSTAYEALPGDLEHEAADTFDRGDHSVTMRRRAVRSTGGHRRVPVIPRPVSASMSVQPAPAPVPESSGRLWLIGAALVIVGLVVIGAFIVKMGDRRADEAVAGQKDVRRLEALLETAEAELLAGKYDEALKDLESAEPQLGGLPALKSRAAQLRSRITLASALTAAEALEKRGETAAALVAYEAIVRDHPGNPEARVAVERLKPPPPPTEPITPPTKTSPRPGKRGDGKPETRAVERPVERPVEVSAPDLLDTQVPAKKAADDPFLPTR